MFVNCMLTLDHINFHNDSNYLKQARRRLIYDEFLIFQLKMQVYKKNNRDHSNGHKKDYDSQKLGEFIDRLPFQLTDAQTESLEEILNDLKSPYRMHRLLQGDVGSGKTIVAAIALYANILAGAQGALMVPTEILAEQHYQSLSTLFEDIMNVELLTGSVKEIGRAHV